MGIHNEPGLKTLSPMPSPEDVVKRMLLFLLDPNDSDRAFVKFSEADEVVMLVNNFGGLSVLELEALTSITLAQLDKDWSIKPTRIYAGVFEASLNGPGFSISLGNLTALAESIKTSSSDLIRLLDAPTNAPAWPKNGYATLPVSKTLQNGKSSITNGNGHHAINHVDGPRGKQKTDNLQDHKVTKSSKSDLPRAGTSESLQRCHSRRARCYKVRYPDG
jgi:hypothetical protein